MRFFDIVVARSENHIIGQNNSIPWNSKKDLAYFKKITTQGRCPNILIMGRCTWESLPVKPLPNRMHIIVSKTLNSEQLSFVYPDAKLWVASSLDDALRLTLPFPGSNVFVVGGASLYKEAMVHPYCSKIYETVVQTIVPEENPSNKYLLSIHEQVFQKVQEYQVIEDSEVSFHVNVWKKKVPIVWWIDQNCYEKDWLDYLFQSIPSISIVDLEQSYVVPGAVIITNQLSTKQTLSAYHLTQTPYTLVHLSDEYLDDDYSCYRSPECVQVFRNYYHPQLQSDKDIAHKITTFGIGYRNQLKLTSVTSLLSEERPYAWSFAGYLKKSDRYLICELFKKCQPYHIHETSGFNSGILEPSVYGSILRQSKFVLCPVGNCSLDTFRLYEALEAGAIPLTLYTNINQPFVRHLAHYWSHIFTDSPHNIPLIMNHTWEQNVQVVEYYLAHPEQYLRVQCHVMTFWKKYKSYLVSTFTNQLWDISHVSPL